MKEPGEYSKEELLSLVEIKNKQIDELRKELDIYIELTKELMLDKAGKNESG
jgi:hypothetical protein